MSGGRSRTRLGVALAVFLMAVSIAGFVVTLILNAFVLDKYAAYGEVPIPGSQTLHLPAGQVKVSFHSLVTGSTSGGGLPVPDLGMTIVPPDGVAQPQVTENIGSTTSVNNDVRRQVWLAQIPVEGDYLVKTDGKVSAFINPRLAFGHGSSAGPLTWVFVGLFGISLVYLVASLWWSVRKRRFTPAAGYPSPAAGYWPPQPAAPYAPTDDGARIEQLKTLAALRDSGALTTAEFEAEKRKVLDGN
jgi:Short C-terminal domain